MLLIAKSLRGFLSQSSWRFTWRATGKTGGALPRGNPGPAAGLAEEDFREYLSQVFFAAEGAAYFILEEAGRYVSALRLEPYEDGLLLEALETAPEERRKGYAAHLICETAAHLKKRGQSACIPMYCVGTPLRCVPTKNAAFGRFPTAPGILTAP